MLHIKNNKFKSIILSVTVTGPPESGTETETPTPMPRLQVPIQESQDNPVQIQEETCYPAKDAHHQQMACPKTKRWTKVDKGGQPSLLQTKQHVSQDKQAEETCHPAQDVHIYQQRTLRWTQTENSGSKPAQISPLQTKNSPRPKRPKPG